MSQKIIFKYTVKDKGGKSAGKVIENVVPDFDWEEFKRLPLAKEFAKKAYFGEVKKIMRDIEEDRKNETMQSDLQSIESVITRSLKFTKVDISEWLKKRNWDECLKSTNIKTINAFKELALTCSQGGIMVDKDMRNHFAIIVSQVADEPKDDLADYLFSRLSLVCEVDDIDDCDL